MRTEWTPEQVSPLEPHLRPVETYRRAHEACAFSDALIRREQTTQVERLRYMAVGLFTVIGRTR